MTIHEAQQRLIFQLYQIYENREAANIADLVMEHLTGWKKIDRILNKQVPLLTNKLELLETYTAQLLSHKPVQYVLNEAWFFGLKLLVNEHVLIPRPETEELVDWILHEVQTGPGDPPLDNLSILDVGTGSGCIAIALKKNRPSAQIISCDISKDALKVAQRNALEHQVDIALLHMDFLDPTQWVHLPAFDIIVSNPPYIPVKDSAAMRANVIGYEPHVALFVENNDPLVFYKAIAQFSAEGLKARGSIFVEIHEELASDVQIAFESLGLVNMELKKDMQGKDRMIRIRKEP